MSTAIAVTRRGLPTYGGATLDVTIIDHDELPTVYVDHDRNWIEMGDHRFSGSPAEFVAWLRDVAAAIEGATS